MVALVVMFAVMLILSEQMLSNRNEGVFAAFSSEAASQESVADDRAVVLHMDDNFLRLAQMTQIEQTKKICGICAIFDRPESMPWRNLRFSS